MTRFLTVLCIACCIASGSVVWSQSSDDNWIRHLTEKEFADLQTYRMPEDLQLKEFILGAHRDFPEVFDWRENAGVTSVKSQGQCGSCWAFAAHGVLEAQLYIQTGIEYNLSEQQLVDCTPGSYGCNGGTTESSWSYLAWEPARIEADYPYEAANNTCRATSWPAYVRTTGYESYYGSETAIKTALMEYGPVATSMGANDNLKAYSGGCYADDSTTPINHAVVIVGWDDTLCDGGSWIVKNSWGTGFGEGGYFYIRRGDVHLGNYFSMVTFDIIPAVSFEMSEFIVSDSSGQSPQAGKTVRSSFSLQNSGREPATGVSANLTSDSPLITIVSGTTALPDMPVGSSIELTDVFEVLISDQAQPGDIIEMMISVLADNGESYIPVTVLNGPMFPLYVNDFEGDSDEGWTHGANRTDQWKRGMHGETDFPRFDPVLPYSGQNMWGTRLLKSGNYAANNDTYLNSPVFDCSGHTKIFLRMKRWLSVEKGVYDNATIQANNQIVWENPLNDDLIDVSWKDILLDVTQYVDESGLLQISFTLTSDGGLEFGGWNIDDVEILSAMVDEFQQNFAGGLDVVLGMPDQTMEPQDQFLLYFELRNYGASKNTTEFVALEVAGDFWFWPDWTQEISSRTRNVSPESFHLETILTFEWPEVDGQIDGIRFWGLALDANSGNIFDYTFIEWGWSGQ